MKCLKVILISLLVSLSVPVMAQTNTNQKDKKDKARAKVEVVNGQTALILKTGRMAQPASFGFSYPADIVLKLDDNTWRMLDSLVTAPWGSAVKVKDIDGYTVEIAKANVNSNVGLMFTSGTKCVAITEEEYRKLK